MARSRPTGPAVSLFPFLAVLVCAMGALIFLLLVFTRQIRASQQQVVVKPVIEKAEPKPTPKPVASPPIVFQGDLHSPGGLLAVTDPPRAPAPKPIPTPIDPNIALRAKLDTLLAQLREANAQRDAAKKKLAAATTDRDTATKELRQSEAKRDLLEAAIDKQRETWLTLKSEHSTLQATLAAVEQEIAIAKGKKAPRGGFQIVPFDGQARTARRPIVIECTKREVRLLGENIRFGPRDLLGYSREDNPLLAAVRAIIQQEELRDPKAPAAYPILIARPDGIVAWYLCREFLKPLEQPFGYELLGEKTPLEVPKSSEETIAAARAAIRKVQPKQGSIRIGGGNGVFGKNEFRMPNDPTKPAFRRAKGGYLVLEKPKTETKQPGGGSSPQGGSRVGNAKSNQEPEAKDRAWGVPHRREGIGLERTLVLDITATQIVLDQLQKLKRGNIDAATYRWLERAIDAQAKAWGRPPRGYFWVPRIRMRYRAGDARFAGELATGLKRLWNLDSDLKTKPGG